MIRPNLLEKNPSLIASLEVDYKREKPKMEFMEYVANRVMVGFFESRDDSFFDWVYETTEPNVEEIKKLYPMLAPDLADFE